MFAICWSVVGLITLLFIYPTKCISSWEDEFDHNTYINQKYRLYWTVSNLTWIEIGLEVQSMGWIGLGISSNAQMSDSDIVMGWVDDNGIVYLQNRYTYSRTVPPLMANQSNIELIEGWQNDTITYIRFYKTIFPCSNNSKQISMGSTYIIYAWNDNDPDPIPQMHLLSNRGYQIINLLQSDSIPIQMPDDTLSFDITMNNAQLNEFYSSYYCQLFELPHYDEIQHIIRYDSLIQNKALISHILLWYCPITLVNATNIGLAQQCDTWANMPESACPGVGAEGKLLYAWGIGANSYYFPENVGFEMSGLLPYSFQYGVLQIAYNNQYEEIIADSSGIRMYYTPSLREYSGDILSIGSSTNSEGIFIPSGIESIRINGYCLKDCINNLVGNPNNHVNIFANINHLHSSGISMKLRHIRNNTELKPINYPLNIIYNFNYQQIIPMINETIILPNDQFILECEYNTKDKTDMTFGGIQPWKMEMCQSFLLVYPRIPSWCNTQFTESQLQRFYTDAAILGYYNYTTQFYNISKLGSLQFYKHFMETPQRLQICNTSSENNIYIDNIPQQYVVYQPPINYGQCPINSTGNECKWNTLDNEHVLNLNNLKGTLIYGPSNNDNILIYQYTPCTDNVLNCNGIANMIQIANLTALNCIKYLAKWEDGVIIPAYNSNLKRWVFTYNNGENCNELESYLRIFWNCDNHAGEFILDSALEISQCLYEIQIRSKYACD